MKKQLFAALATVALLIMGRALATEGSLHPGGRVESVYKGTDIICQDEKSARAFVQALAKNTLIAVILVALPQCDRVKMVGHQTAPIFLTPLLGTQGESYGAHLIEYKRGEKFFETGNFLIRLK